MCTMNPGQEIHSIPGSGRAQLKRKHAIAYPCEIRITGKGLWVMGRPK